MAASQQDFVEGTEFTGESDITGALLDQLVSAAYPASDKGLVVTTIDTGIIPDVPDAAATTKWKRYLWRRVLASSVVVYTWNDNAVNDATYLKWQAITVASIPAGYIVNSMLAANSVQNSNIVSMEYAKLTGAPTLWYQIGSAAAGGDLTGNYPDPTVGVGKIDYTKMAALTINQSVVSLGLAATPGSGIAVANIFPHTIASYFLRTKSDLTACEWAKSYFTEISTLGTAYQIPRVNAGATAIEWSSNTNTILQKVMAQSTVTGSGATTVPFDNTIPTWAEGNAIAALDTAITPKLATSYLHVEAVVQIASAAGALHNLVLALFRDPAGTDAAAAVNYNGAFSATTEDLKTYTIKFKVLAGSTSTTTFKLRYGAEAGTSYLNQTPGGSVYGGVISSMSVTEVAV